MILQKIQELFSENKKSLLYIVGVFLFSFLFSDFAFAESEAESVSGIIKAIEGFLVGISMVLALMTYLVTLFLDPAWINGTIFDLDIYFKKIWILISNVVYFIFAFLLIWIAFMNIIGKGDEKYQLKQVLPKFIVGVLIVPFSWFIVQFILSLSAILTVTALSIPFDTFKDFQAVTSEIKIPKACNIDLTGIEKASKAGEDVVVKDVLDCGKEGKVTLADAFNSEEFSNSIFGLVSTYTFGVISFDAVNDISSEKLSNINTYAALLVKVVIDLLFVLIYAILILALGLVLFVRGTYLWIYTMLSPIFGLMYFFDKQEGGGEGFFGKFSVSEFIKLALVPVYAMAALSFGLLFLFVVGNGFAGSDAKNKSHTFETNDAGDTVYVIGSKDGGSNQFKLTVKGSVGNDSKDSFLGALTAQSKTGGKLGVIGNLVMQVFGVIILWGAIMAALQSSKVTEAVVKPLADFGNQVGQLAAKSPGYLPVFGGQSMQSMKNVGNAAQSHMTTSANNRSQSFLDNNKLFGADGSEVAKSLRGLEGTIQNANSKPAQVAAVHKILEAVKGDTKKLYTEPEARKRLFEVATRMDIKFPESIKTANDINGPGRLEELFNAMEKKDSINFEGVINKAAGGGIQLKHIEDEVKNRQSGTASASDNLVKPNLNIDIKSEYITKLATGGTLDSTELGDLATMIAAKIRTVGGTGKFTNTDMEDILVGDGIKKEDAIKIIGIKAIQDELLKPDETK